MKPKNPFSIVNRPEELTSPREYLNSIVSTALKSQTKGALSLDRVPPALLEALFSLTNNVQPKSSAYTVERSATKKAVNKKAAPVAKKAKTEAGVTAAATLPADVVKVIEKAVEGTVASTVGVLDLGAWVSGLPDLLMVMNKSQDSLVFLELQTPVPAGLIKTKEPLTKWAENMLGRPVPVEDSKDLSRNMLAEEFFYFAESVRVQYKLDVLVGLTPAMIAFEDKGVPKWNYFAAGVDGVSVVSTFELREFSAKAGRPYEAAIGMLIAAQVFALRNDIEYHPETRGCIFDFNDNRTDLIESIKSMRIDPTCLAHFHDQTEARNAQSLVAALARIKEAKRG